MQQFFKTIKDEVTEELIEKKSRFIAYIFPIENEDDVSKKIEKIKKLNREAKHNVFAYRLNNGVEKYSDDGEPSGTAGVPILDILRGANLSNVLVVVTRYFGGILLGTGGLVRAYAGVSKLALDKAVQVEMKLCIKYKIMIDYEQYNLIQYYCKTHDITVLETQFLEKVEIIVLVVDSMTSNFLHDLSEITSNNAVIQEVEKCYHE